MTKDEEQKLRQEFREKDFIWTKLFEPNTCIWAPSCTPQEVEDYLIAKVKEKEEEGIDNALKLINVIESYVIGYDENLMFNSIAPYQAKMRKRLKEIRDDLLKSLTQSPKEKGK